MRVLVIGLLLALFVAGCVNPPPSPGSRVGIAWTSRNNTHLILDYLPLKDYPALKKFHKLREVQFWYRTATDEKMEALARVGFTNLSCATMNGSSHITDRSVEALARIPSMHSLGLEGASITDAGLKLIAARMQPWGINVASCSNITADGLLTLIQTDTLRYISVSADHLTTAEVIRLLERSRNLDRFYIVGSSRHLVHGAIERAAAAKAHAQGTDLRVVFLPKGSISMDFPLPNP
jgi:hypothetical protein